MQCAWKRLIFLRRSGPTTILLLCPSWRVLVQESQTTLERHFRLCNFPPPYILLALVVSCSSFLFSSAAWIGFCATVHSTQSPGSRGNVCVRLVERLRRRRFFVLVLNSKAQQVQPTVLPPLLLREPALLCCFCWLYALLDGCSSSARC